MSNKQFPSGLQAVLWSKSLNNLDIDRDKNYIINQVLAFGFLEHLQWLFKIYPKEIVRKTFLNNPIRTYSVKSLDFIKLILFGKKQVDLDEKKYVQHSL